AYHFQQLASSSTPIHECRTYYLKSGKRTETLCPVRFYFSAISQATHPEKSNNLLQCRSHLIHHDFA
ncbi:hypothetical protein L9W73_14505, partial [Vibrio aestuarianus]